jgi:hypothetical protein
LLAAIDGIKKREIEMITDILAPPAVASAARATEDLRENILRSAVDESESPSCWLGRPATLIGKIPVILPTRRLRA